VPDRNQLNGERIYFGSYSEISVHDHLAPLSFDHGETEHHGGKPVEEGRRDGGRERETERERERENTMTSFFQPGPTS
jgi:hypothetical protein